MSGPDIPLLRRQALQVLRRNRRVAVHPVTGARLRYTCPSPGRYPFQWFWDSCFIAVALAHLDPEAAQEELDLLLAGQERSGRIGHVQLWERRRLFAPASYWCWLQSEGQSMPRHTSLIQPPVLALAVERYHQLTGDGAFVRRALPALDRYYAWLGRARDLTGDGLLAIIAPWESGMDHRPSYDAAFGLSHPAPPWQLVIEPRVLDVANRLHVAAPWFARWPRRFLVQDVLVNSVYVDGLRTLARLHGVAGDDGAAWQAQAQRV